MNFNPTENQQLIRQSVKDFAAQHIAPHVMEWDEVQHFPVDLFKKMGEQGLMGILVPEQYGGSGLGYFEYVDAIVEVSKVCGAIGLSMAAHNSLCTGHIMQFGNDEQRAKWLPKLATAEWIGAWGLTEPNTGSDAMNMKTIGEQDGDYWIINGSKSWITHGKSSQVAVVMVRTGNVRDSKGITAFVIEKDTPGFTSGKKEDKLGMRASETTTLHFENCKVHKNQILGHVGDGFKQAMKVLDGGRISIAALGLGIGMGAYEAAAKYALEREQFDKPIAHFQAISFKLADMATRLDAGKLLTYQACDLKNNNRPVTKQSAIAKYYTSEAAVDIATDAIQVFGGYGYTKEYPVEKFYRDSKLCTIGEGTSEIQKLVISREVIKENAI